MNWPHTRGRALVERPHRVEASLWRRLRFEAQARCREALFKLHLPFAKMLAGVEYRRKADLGLDRGDFEQFSFGALLEAIDRYDPLHGAPFQSFARPRIKGAFIDGLAKASEVGAQIGYRRRIETDRLRSIQGDEAAPSARDPLLEFGELATLLALGFVTEDAIQRQSISKTSPLNPFETSAWRDIELSILAAIERLPDRERTIIEQHYCGGVDFAHIAKLLGLTKGRVSQLHRRALGRLREHLRRFE